jgi:putative FmdB family regulatory protein
MPIYEYYCSHCHHRLELIQKVSDSPETHCPACQTDNLTKLVSAPQFKLKGTGWYETDFKTKPQKNAKQESNKANTSGSEKSSKGSKKAGSDSKST